MAERTPSSAAAMPILEHYPAQGGPAELVEVSRVPFTLGRALTHDRTVYSVGVSRDHAEIVRVGDGYAVRDLGSTNGTFVNGRPVIIAELADGDIIHLGDVEFRFRRSERNSGPFAAFDGNVHETLRIPLAVHESLLVGHQLIHDMIEYRAVRTVFQPIVALDSRAILAFEALGRGTMPGVPELPMPLLQLADRCNMAVGLSRAFRARALEDSVVLPPGAIVFLNVHPRELTAPDFLESLPKIQPAAPNGHRFVVEITETAVTDVSTMARMRQSLLNLGYGLAYDDFGAGQARLLELTDVPPDYLKLDRGLIEGVEQLMPRRHLVRALVKLVADLGVRVVAEGVETEEVARICEALGCHLGQGFYFGEGVETEGWVRQ